MYNYSPHAIRDLMRKAEEFEGSGMPATSAMLQNYCGLLRDAIKFALPEGGRIIEIATPVSEEDLAYFRLPYPVIALEYCISDSAIDHDAVQDSPSPKRICLAHEVPPCEEYIDGAVSALPIWFDSTLGHWVCSPYVAVIPRRQDIITRIDHIEARGVKSTSLAYLLIPCLSEMVNQQIKRLGEKETRRLGHLDIMDELMALCNFLSALGCSNVRAVDSERKDVIAKVNRKRQSKGKLPLFSYKVLEIVVPQNRRVTLETQQANSRQSPRVHLRRGHIRKLSSEVRVWVNACVVGKKHGMIVKDYKVTPGAKRVS